MDGLEVTRSLREAGRDCRILILSMHDNPEYVLEALRAGADGYLLKDADPSELREAVQVVGSGKEPGALGGGESEMRGSSFRTGAPEAVHGHNGGRRQRVWSKSSSRMGPGSAGMICSGRFVPFRQSAGHLFGMPSKPRDD
jgi:hypothetical protein